MTVLPADHRADLQKLEKIDGETGLIVDGRGIRVAVSKLREGSDAAFSVAGKPNSRTWSVGEQRRSHERCRHNEDNGRFADYFIHLLLGIKLRDAPVGSTIWIQRI